MHKYAALTIIVNYSNISSWIVDIWIWNVLNVNYDSTAKFMFV